MQLPELVEENILAVRNVIEELKLTTNTVFIGGVGRYLANKEKSESVGDVDIAVNKNLASEYWKFVSGLLKAGYRPVYDVLEVEKQICVEWNPIQPDYAHAGAFRIAPKKYERKPENKHLNLDIIMSKRALNSIKGAEKWVYLIKKCQSKPTENEIKKGHEDLLKNLPTEEFINRIFTLSTLLSGCCVMRC